MPHSSSQNGNALWFILLVVALFGALTATLSRNTSSVNQAGNIEQARVKAASILRYSTAVQTAINQMMLRGISENELDFEEFGEDHTNTNCENDDCKVFNTSGGGLSYRKLSSVISEDLDTDTNWIASAQNLVYLAGCDEKSSDCTDLLLIAPNIPRALCMQINTLQNITNTNNEPPKASVFLTNIAFDGTYTDTINSYALGETKASGADSEIQSKNAACIEYSDKYYFYQLLIAR